MRKLLAFFLALSTILCPIFSASALAVEDNLPFDDVGEKHWARKGVVWAYEQGLTSGTGAKTFSPQKPLTKAMFYMMLYRLEGCPTPEEVTLRYEDVPENAYYRDALQWASTAGLIDWRMIRFYPNEPICRGDMAEALFGYEIYYRDTHHPELPQWTLVEPEPFPPQFTDVNRDSDKCWGIRFILQNGIMVGRSSTTFAPNAGSTRAEGVFVLWNTYKYLQTNYEKNGVSPVTSGNTD